MRKQLDYDSFNYERRYTIKWISNISDKLDLFLSYAWEESLYKEVWKEIYGFDGAYYISNYGRVLSLKHNGYKLIKPFLENDYYYVDLCNNSQKIRYSIHKLVAQAFIANPQKKNIVHHRNTNSKDNHVSNLQWVTYKEHIEIHREINKKRKERKQKKESNTSIE